MKKRLFMVFVLVLTAGLLFVPVICHADNILNNPGFENESGNQPTGWITESFNSSVKFEVVDEGAHAGSKCMAVINTKPNDSKVIQDIRVEPGEVYAVSCWIRTEDIKQAAGSANITLLYDRGIYTSAEYYDTNKKWEKMQFKIKLMDDGSDKLRLILRFGGQGTTNKGKVYFDDVTVEKIENPDGSIASFYIPPEDDGGSPITKDNSGHRSGTDSNTNKTILYTGLAALAIILLVFIEIKFAKNRKRNQKDQEEFNFDDEFDSEADSEEHVKSVQTAESDTEESLTGNEEDSLSADASGKHENNEETGEVETEDKDEKKDKTFM